MEDVMVESHEMWHVNYLLALHVDILENLMLMWFERRKEIASSTKLEIDGDFGSWRTNVKEKNQSFS